MAIQEFSYYLNRPIEKFESVQKSNFGKLNAIVNSKEDNVIYEEHFSGFISPFDGSQHKEMIFKAMYPNYKLLYFFDIAMRKTDNIFLCLLPDNEVEKRNIANHNNVCIEFNRLIKKHIKYRSKSNPYYSSEYNIIIIDNFEVINQMKLRQSTSKESVDAHKLRKEVLFSDFSVSPNVELSILDSIFLSPKINSRTGIESKALIKNSTGNRMLANVDAYNQVISNLVPPEISNCHEPFYRSDFVRHSANSIDDEYSICIKFPMIKGISSYFKSECRPNQKQDPNSYLRDLTNMEIGINNQVKYSAFSSKNEIIEKIRQTEFFSEQDFLPEYSLASMKKSLDVISDNRELLYRDYADRIFKQFSTSSLTVSEKQKSELLARDLCDEMKYKIKESSDSYFSSIHRSIMENVSRVKTISSRNSLYAPEDVGWIYLRDMQLNLDEIKNSPYYNILHLRKINIEKIRKLMNNPIRNTIISGLLVRSRSALLNDIINEVASLGFGQSEFDNQLRILEESKIIYRINDRLFLDTNDF